MKKTGNVRWVDPQSLEPEYIIINDRDQVYVGLIGGEPNFSTNIDRARVFQGQAKFKTLKRYSWCKIEQVFL